jgi:hypothetical protein
MYGIHQTAGVLDSPSLPKSVQPGAKKGIQGICTPRAAKKTTDVATEPPVPCSPGTASSSDRGE